MYKAKISVKSKIMLRDFDTCLSDIYLSNDLKTLKSED